MKSIWTIMDLEFTLFRRGWAIWVVALAMVCLGVWNASKVRYYPLAVWLQFSITALFMTLILVFVTGNQIQQDCEHRIDGVILSTPISTSIYVLGKFLASLLMMLGLASLELVASIFVDLLPGWPHPPALLGESLFPSLGIWPYIIGWCYLVITPILFGAALMLFGITLTRGKRIISYMVVLAIWLIPVLFWGHTYTSDHRMADWFDLSTTSYFYNYSTDTNPLFQKMITDGAFPPSQSLGQQIMQQVRSGIPPTYLPLTFFENRLLFIGLGFLLFLGVIYVVRQKRCE